MAAACPLPASPSTSAFGDKILEQATSSTEIRVTIEDNPMFSPTADRPTCPADIAAEIEKKLTEKSEVSYNILISAADVEHHIRSVCDIGQMLHKAGHYVVLAHLHHRNVLALEYGLDFMPFEPELFESLHHRASDWIRANLDKFHAQPYRRWKNWTDDDKHQLSRLAYEINVTNTAFEKIMTRLEKNYDLIIGNFETRYPSTYYGALPFIPVLYMNPLILHSRGPPPFSGFPTNCDKVEIARYSKAQRNIFRMLTDKLLIWWNSYKIRALSVNSWWVDQPRELGIYRYPEGLDYTECGPKISKKWMRIDPDCSKFETGKTFQIPRTAQYLPGKLIYLTLGNLGTDATEWMSEFLKLLDNIPHRFIFSSGPKLLQTPSNVWGSRHLVDSEVIKAVDLVITHGGNTSLMEIIYHKKPMIIIPFFLDQYDNAQRVVECGIGRRLNTWNINSETIYQTITDTLTDKNIPIKLAELSEQMRISDSRLRLRYRIEEIIRAFRARKA